MRRRDAAAVFGFALIVLGSPFVSATGGGSVDNALPTVPTFTHTGGATQPTGSVDVFTATIADKNGEEDIVSVKIATTSGPAASIEHAVLESERSTATEPVAFTDGWKVWNPVAGDGALSVRVQVTLANAGAQTWTFSAKDEEPYQTGPAPAISITVSSAITVHADPVAANGALQTGARWGAWSAEPGAANVLATNYLRVDNTGGVPTQAFTVDFSQTLFRGITTSTKTIPLDGNIQFAWWEDPTPATTSPAQGTYTFSEPSPDGSVTPSFTAAGRIIYVLYRLVALPDPLLDQQYEASLTVTPL